jgi:hypothetical protein
MARDQMRDDLDVGLGGEVRADGLELLLELHVVLHDPVDHDVHPVLGVVVRVRILFADPAVGGPAGVADAGRGGRSQHGDAAAVVCDDRLQRCEVAHRADRFQRPIDLQRDPGRVITPVLEFLQAGEEDFLNRPLADVSDDAAHDRASLRLRPESLLVNQF